jgi:hypothetical protein
LKFFAGLLFSRWKKIERHAMGLRAKVTLAANGHAEQPQGQKQEADAFLPTSEMAERLCVTPPTLLKWGKSGRIPFVQLERKVLWHLPSVTAALLKLQRLNGSAL